jgi:WS/DGAT/MGAT family acyltransferase
MHDFAPGASLKLLYILGTIGNMQQLSGLDSVFVMGEIPAVPLHISALFIYDPSTAKGDGSEEGGFNYQSLNERLRQTVDHAVPLMRCKLESVAMDLDSPYWVEDENFNLAFHLQRVDLPQPADWQQVYDLCSRLHAEPLERSRPLWQAWYIEGLDHLDGIPKGAVGVFIKVHHAMMDGKSAIRLFNSLHQAGDLSPDSSDPAASGGSAQGHEVPSAELGLSHFSRPGLMKKWFRAYRHNALKPLHLSAAVGSLVPKLIDLQSIRDGLSKTASNKTVANEVKEKPIIPHTLFNRPLSANRLVGHVRLPMDEVHRLATSAGVTINDLAIAVVSGAMRHYLKTKNALPGASLIAGMPIDIRTKDDQGSTGNIISFANVPLHTDIIDTKARLQAINGGTKESKAHNKKLGSGVLKHITDNLYHGAVISLARWFVESGLIYKTTPINHTVISNVPGMQKPCYLNGARLVDYLGFGPIAPTMGVFHLVSSTNEVLSVTFTTCPEVIDDPQLYRESLQLSWQALLEAYEGDG